MLPFAIGHTTALLSPQLNIEWNFWLVIWICRSSGSVGWCDSRLPLCLYGVTILTVTLGFGEIVPVVFRNLTSVQIYEPISKILAHLIAQSIICLVGCQKPINLTGVKQHQSDWASSSSLHRHIPNW